MRAVVEDRAVVDSMLAVFARHGPRSTKVEISEALRREQVERGLVFEYCLITEELAYARQICTRHNWPMIDVSRRSIEETAAAIVALRSRTR